MGAKTLAACQEVPGVYLHAIGGAASLIAQTVKRVLGVYKQDFGVPEAMWVIEVKDFPAVVTMDRTAAACMPKWKPDLNPSWMNCSAKA